MTPKLTFFQSIQRPMTNKIVRVSAFFRSRSTPLPKYCSFGAKPEPDGVLRVNEKCVELESCGTYLYSGEAGAVGLCFVMAICSIAFTFWVVGVENLTWEIVACAMLYLIVIVGMALASYYWLGGHKTRGAHIRVHRGTRKLYSISARCRTLSVLDWDHIEPLIGYLTLNVAGDSTGLRPLYLIGVDYNMEPPTEICVACGNAGLTDQSAKALWSYLQVFMERGPEGLPAPAPLPSAPKLSRWRTTVQPYSEWFCRLRRRLGDCYGLILAPITIPLSILGLMFEVFPESVGAFLQYNVPYAQFPKEIDRLCGFEEKRKPVIRVNGERIDL